MCYLTSAEVAEDVEASSVFAFLTRYIYTYMTTLRVIRRIWGRGWGLVLCDSQSSSQQLSAAVRSSSSSSSQLLELVM